jgi:sporulation protein YlmC with PRC-barrel domain
MNRIRWLGMVAAFGALLVAPCHAQPAGQPGAPPNPKPTATAPAGTLQKAKNSWRGRTLLGAAVFNDNGQRVGTVNDLLITDDGRVDQVVLSVGRVRGKFVAVPFSQLRFAPSRSAPPVVAADAVPAPAQLSTDNTYGVVLPGATTDSLAKMETFRFAP